MDSIFNRPPSISEDTLQYTIYPSPESSSSEAAVAALGAQIQNLTNSLLLPRDFIWHRDSFEVKVVPALPHEIGGNVSASAPAPAQGSERGREKRWKLEGRMRVGDSVDDEWCVVWLFRELTRTLDIAVSIFDSDGEFLLIEAAESLPAWVSPTNAENRVWLYQSKLHLIPIFYHSPPNIPRIHRQIPASQGEDEMNDSAFDTDAEDYLGPADAVRLLRDESVDSEAPDEVQSRVWARISKYPDAIKEHIHRCAAYIPLDVALALQSNPSLVQRAVETFYTRDALQLRAVQKMARFPPSASTLATVHMSRPAYAQLVGQKFHPPKVFGRWTEPESSAEWKRKSIGMKIACGFEMLYAESKRQSHSLNTAATSEGVEAMKDALKRDTAYQQYIQSLNKVSYFGNEAQGSARWNELESQAAKVWIDIRKVDDASRKSFATSVNEAISQYQASKPTPGNDDQHEQSFFNGEDSDEWLGIDSEMLDGMLQSSFNPTSSPSQKKKKKNTPGGDALESGEGDDAATNAEAERLQQLAGKVQAFVDGKGDIDGAKFDDDLLSDEDFSSDSDDDDDLTKDSAPSHSSSDSDSDSDSDLDSDPLDDTAKAERKRKAIDALVPALPASEYGIMPKSFSNSQPVTAPTLGTETVPSASGSSSLNARPVRQPILVRDKYDGVDSDDDSEFDDDDDVGGGGGGSGRLRVPMAEDDEESDEDRPTVVGEIEVDMEAEEEEFLKFSREALGITEDQWNDILRERGERGAFIPSTAEHLPPPSEPSRMSKPKQSGKGKKASTQDTTAPTTGPNPNLDSFEAVMKAMDDALAAQLAGKSPSASTPAPSSANAKNDAKGKGKAPTRAPPMGAIPEDESDDEDLDDIEGQMSAELKAALEAEDGSDGDGDGDGETDIDYNLIKNFLHSFQAQGGLAGPVSNLAGRLNGDGWKLPRDSS